MRRLPQTLADYVVVAISPALIMTLIGSLVFFLLEVFYQGEYQARLQYVFALFVLATVLIGRIAIEEGSSHAALFALPMAIVTGLAMMRFVEFQANVSPFIHLLINLSLMGLVWFSAHQLTWDCTVIDETVDASGSGLLDKFTWFRKPVLAESKSSLAAWIAWLQAWLERPRQPHALGRWVVYFGIATLPLFSIGQLFLPVHEVGRRRYAFFLLCLYLASALGLLLTTSFLSLRRYLRQRQLEMPIAMTAAWLTTGGLLIGATIMLAAILPRPAAEYEIAELPIVFGSPGQQKTSQRAVGNDGKPDNQHPANQVKPGDPQAEQTASSKQGQASDPQAKDKQSGSQGEQDKSQSGDKPAEKTAESNQSQATSPTKGTDNNKPTSSQSSSKASPPPSARFSSPPLRTVTWLRWVIYGLLFALLIAVAWWQRAQIVAAWKQFLQSLRDFWRRFLGRYAGVWTEARDGDKPPTTQRSRSLADYPNPFVTGEANRWPANKLVQYSFAALEAWGQERNCPHAATQTPLEFAQQVGSAAPHLAREAQRLAEMVSLVAYGSSELSQRAGEQLRTLWQLLARETPPASPQV